MTLIQEVYRALARRYRKKAATGHECEEHLRNERTRALRATPEAIQFFN